MTTSKSDSVISVWLGKSPISTRVPCNLAVHQHTWLQNSLEKKYPHINMEAYDKGVDLFAFGTLLWELFAREVPYEGLDP